MWFEWIKKKKNRALGGWAGGACTTLTVKSHPPFQDGTDASHERKLDNAQDQGGGGRAGRLGFS